MAPSITLILSTVFLAYMAHSMWVIYGIFYPTPCIGDSKCIKPYLQRNKNLEMKVFTSVKSQPSSEKYMDLIWHKPKFAYSEKLEETLNVSLPRQTVRNGSLYAHVVVHPRGEGISSGLASWSSARITAYSLPRPTVINLLGDSQPNGGKDKGKKATSPTVPVTHWRSKLSIGIMKDLIAFDRMQIPAEVYRYLRISSRGEYLPVVFIDELSFRLKDLLPVNSSVKQMPLTISYSPVSVGKLRMWTSIQESFKLLASLGFTEKDTDEVKGIFADTNFYLLMLTFGVAAFHLLFDFLAFKNDIMYWKKRTTMEGLSTRAVLWRSVSTAIIFFYLLDEDTSLLVLIPAGIGTVIEFWKVKKALKISVEWQGWRPVLSFGEVTQKELETKAFDSQAMKYLSYVLYPLCVGGAAYSLLYVEHKSWYSWCLQSLVNGVYAFGFLFMLPQLFVNYKLKSVAHLPWRAFMYKAFNTFIDDVFAFIITMPTAHRLACFRDDVVFLIYLYQRWLYPVDWTRVNEYGQSFDQALGEGKPAVKSEESKKTK